MKRAARNICRIILAAFLCYVMYPHMASAKSLDIIMNKQHFIFLCCCWLFVFFYHWPPSTFPVTTHKHTRIVSQGGTLQSTSALLQLPCPVSTAAFFRGPSNSESLSKQISAPPPRDLAGSVTQSVKQPSRTVKYSTPGGPGNLSR